MEFFYRINCDKGRREVKENFGGGSVSGGQIISDNRIVAKLGGRMVLFIKV